MWREVQLFSPGDLHEGAAELCTCREEQESPLNEVLRFPLLRETAAVLGLPF